MTKATNSAPDGAGEIGAEAAKKAAEAEKAEIERAKAALEEQAARMALEKAQRERVAEESPLAGAKRAAEDRKAIAAARQEAAASRQKQLGALIPDFGKVAEGGELKTGEGPVLFGPTLAQRALRAAAADLAAPCLAALDKSDVRSWRLLVTPDADLVSSDAVYQDVLAGIAQMHNAMRPLLLPREPDEPVRDLRQLDSLQEARLDDGMRRLMTSSVPALDLAATAVAALPQALSMLLPRRTLSNGNFELEGTAAAAAAIGQLGGEGRGTIVHDGFRLLPDGGTVLARLGALEASRQELAGLRLALESEEAAATAALSAGEEQVKALGKKLEKAEGEAKADLEETLAAEQRRLDEQRRALAATSARIGLIESALAAVDEFLTALRATPEGAARSPLATAILREQLHQDAGERFTHVLLVKADEGATHQILDDRRIRADRVSAIGLVNVTYMLIETATSAVAAAGVASGSATLAGRIGSSLELEPRRRSWPRWRWRRNTD